MPILEERRNFKYDGRYKIPGENAAEIEEIIDLAFQRFANITGMKRKMVLLQHDTAIFAEHVLERRNRERKLMAKYGKKYNIEIVNSFDHIYVPEKRDELWFGYKGYGHHTPYGNKVVCDVVLNWLRKEISS